MNQRKKETPIEEKLTLAEARARIKEFAGMKKIEGKTGGAAVPAGHPSRPTGDEKGSTLKGKS
jgi:hypothetical protein